MFQNHDCLTISQSLTPNSKLATYSYQMVNHFSYKATVASQLRTMFIYVHMPLQKIFTKLDVIV